MWVVDNEGESEGENDGDWCEYDGVEIGVCDCVDDLWVGEDVDVVGEVYEVWVIEFVGVGE